MNTFLRSLWVALGDLLFSFAAKSRLVLFVAADTNASSLATMPSEGLRPAFGRGPLWLWFFFDEDQADDVDDIGTNLAEANDTFIFLRLAKNSVVLDFFAFGTAFDSGGGETILTDVVLNAAVDGNAAADFHLADAVDTLQAGGRINAGDGTAPVTSPLGKRIEADGATLFIQTDTAPNSAPASGRQMLIGVLVGDKPLSPIT